VVSRDQNPTIGSHEYFARLFEVEEAHWWSKGMRAVAERMLDAHIGGATGLDVLDAGCGTGVTLSWLERFSAPRQVVGTDIAELALRFCKDRGHSLLYRGSVVELPFKDRSFDLVVCNDVIQHLAGLDADRAAMREFSRVLRPGGLLLVRTNSNQGAGDGDAEADDYRRYSLARVRELVEAAGLSLVKATHANTVMSVVPTIKRALERGPHRHSDHGLGIRLLPPILRPLNAALFALMCLEARVLARPRVVSSFGQTIMFLARRPAEGGELHR
jgi:ubiquinone/menaquinone biosynthesis C-methylase UbiE